MKIKEMLHEHEGRGKIGTLQFHSPRRVIFHITYNLYIFNRMQTLTTNTNVRIRLINICITRERCLIKLSFLNVWFRHNSGCADLCSSQFNFGRT